MEITVLGTASIGGVPEWDCTCPNCAVARINPKYKRTRSSITISLDGHQQILFDAGHDLKTQLESNKIVPQPKTAGKTYRESRIDSIFLTHGHADHTVGIAEFCTGKSFEIPLYGPPDLIGFLFGTEEKPNYFGELGRLSKNYVNPIPLNEETIIEPLVGLEVRGLEVPHTQVLDDGSKYPTTTYAYEIRYQEKRVVYAPDIGRLDQSFLDLIKGVDVFFMDATFWWDNELERVSGIPVTSYQLGHVPQEAAIEQLRDIEIKRVIYTHFNHTNPVLDISSHYRKKITNLGQEIAQDGMKIIV
jgi:pyrroloquinoline quinone biosynthesis protein B